MKKIVEFFKKPYIGRLTRTQYILGFIVNFIIQIIGIVFLISFKGAIAFNSDLLFSIAANLPFLIITTLAFILTTISLYTMWGLIVRRLHDLGYSGWMVLIGVIPYINFILLILVLFTPGQNNENKYGNNFKTLNPIKIIMNKNKVSSFDTSDKYLIPIAFVFSIIVTIWLCLYK